MVMAIRSAPPIGLRVANDMYADLDSSCQKQIKMSLPALPRSRGRGLRAEMVGQRLVPLCVLGEPPGAAELPVAGSMTACIWSGPTSITICDPSGAWAWMR
jgi:hypothetical protein